MKKIRVYADTSVFGGVFDKEFEKTSKTFFEQAKQGNFALVISPLVEDEISLAPIKVQQFFNETLPIVEVVSISEQATELADGYLNAKIVTGKYAKDALHVALATVSGCTLIVSWNFKHIVHFQKIALYNAVNVINGYSQISIFTPSEVIRYEEE